MGVGSGLHMYDAVVKRSRSLFHLLISFCYRYVNGKLSCKSKVGPLPSTSGKIVVSDVENRQAKIPYVNLLLLTSDRCLNIVVQYGPRYLLRI